MTSFSSQVSREKKQQATQEREREKNDRAITLLATLIDEVAAGHSANVPVPYSKLWFRVQEFLEALDDRGRK